MAAEAVYGEPPPVLAQVGPDAVQVSPLKPGAEAIEDLAESSLARVVVRTPGGALERRYVLAHALRALVPGGELTALAPKTRGGARLAGELAAFGCEVHEHARRHHRICRTRRPTETKGLDAAIAAGGPSVAPGTGLWSQPGVFSWDRLDPGTALLLRAAPSLTGRGADLGCGIGVLALKVLDSLDVTSLTCIDIDRRALAAARRNLHDPRATFVQHDIRASAAGPTDLDFVIMNPPFHDDGQEDRGLGLAFISAAASMLRTGGVCWMVANIALPYEARLNAVFNRSSVSARDGGYKIYEAIR